MHGGKRTGAGRRAASIDLTEVEKLGALQCTDEEIAAWFGVTARTLERRKKNGEPCNMAIPSQARPETAGKV
jgi:hypothetical protein